MGLTAAPATVAPETDAVPSTAAPGPVAADAMHSASEAADARHPDGPDGPPAALANTQPAACAAANAAAHEETVKPRPTSGAASVSVLDKDLVPCDTLGQLLRRMLRLLGRPHEVSNSMLVVTSRAPLPPLEDSNATW